MAKQPTIMYWCDPCLNEIQDEKDAHSPGHTTSAGWPAMVLELCDAHSKAGHDQVTRWAEEYGRPYADEIESGQPRKPKNGKTTKTPKASAPLSSHSKHQPSGREYLLTDDGRYQCPGCTMTYSSPGRLDNHVDKKHPDLA